MKTRKRKRLWTAADDIVTQAFSEYKIFSLSEAVFSQPYKSVESIGRFPVILHGFLTEQKRKELVDATSPDGPVMATGERVTDHVQVLALKEGVIRGK